MHAMCNPDSPMAQGMSVNGLISVCCHGCRNVLAPLLSGGATCCMPFFDAVQFWEVAPLRVSERAGMPWPVLCRNVQHRGHTNSRQQVTYIGVCIYIYIYCSIYIYILQQLLWDLVLRLQWAAAFRATPDWLSPGSFDRCEEDTSCILKRNLSSAEVCIQCSSAAICCAVL